MKSLSAYPAQLPYFVNTIWISAVVGQIHFPTLPQKKGLNLAEIETRLTELQNSKAENPEEYWVNATYPEIIDHILVRYHQRIVNNFKN